MLTTTKHMFTQEILNLQKLQVTSLTGPIDIYWLNKTYQAAPYLTQENGSVNGYMITDDKGTLYEYYLTQHNSFDNFKEATTNRMIQAAIISTRNPILIEYCSKYFSNSENIPL